MSENFQAVLTEDALTIPPRTTKTIRASCDHPSERNTTFTVTPLEKFTETASLLISHSMSTIYDRKVPVRVTNTTETLHLIKSYIESAEFSVVTAEKSKFNKPADTAILSMIPDGDPDPIAYLNELRRTNKPEQQRNTFWFLTPEHIVTLKSTHQYKHESSMNCMN